MLITYVTLVGSKLYGIATENSDTDIKGWGFEAEDEIYGQRVRKQQDLENGVEDGPAKVEGTIYTLRRYLLLCLKSNPTVCELAFAAPEYHIHKSDPIAEEVNEFVRNNLITKHLFKAYSAYHRAQMRKMESMQRTGKRKDIVDQYGYDLKFCSHAYRLSRQCIEMLESGKMYPTMTEKDKAICLAIRAGEYTKEQAVSLLKSVDEGMYEAYKKTSIPDAPSFQKVNDFTRFMYRKYVRSIAEMETAQFGVSYDKIDNQYFKQLFENPNHDDISSQQETEGE